MSTPKEKEKPEAKKANIIEQRHRCLPQTITVEQLGKWITEHQKKVIVHTVKTPLTPKEVSDLEHKSSAASRALDTLDETMEKIKDIIKNGTTFDGTHNIPQDVQIPATKGTKALKANRLYADESIQKGYNEENTDVYIIPFPDEETMVAVDIKGNEWVDYTKPMTKDESGLYGKLFVKGEDGQMRKLKLDEVDVNKFSGTATIKTKKEADKLF